MRIRTIKPEFWRSDDITALSREDRLLFVGLWSYVDDNGVGIDDERRITADLFAFEDDQKATRDYVREGLATLSRVLHPAQDAPLITRYEVDGKRYFHVTKWNDHQRVDRPGRSRYPLPPSASTSEDGPDPDPDGGLFDLDSREARESVATGTGEKGNRGTGEQGTDSPDAHASSALVPTRGKGATKGTGYSASFEEWWSIYPKRVSKAAAAKAYAKACKGRPLREGETRAQSLAVRAATWAAHWERTGQDPQYIPYPATWLNRGDYETPPPRPLTSVPVRRDPDVNGGLGGGTSAERANAFLSLRGTRGPNGERLDGRTTG
jgi:hypothetical protein